MLNLLLIVVGFWTGESSLNRMPDSLRLETVNGKSYIIHQVDKGETLFSISRRYGAALSAVLESNPGADSGIDAGQEIKVPYSGRLKDKNVDGVVHVVTEKQTLYSIARQYGVSVDQIRDWNNLGEKNIQVGMKLRVKNSTQFSVSPKEDILSRPQKEVTHIVVEKETLYAIARAYQVSVNDLIKWNKLTSSSVKTGQQLLIKLEQATQTNDEPVEVKVTKTENTPVKLGQLTPEKIEPVNTDEKNESGFALLSERSGESRKYLAYHRTIPEGTVLRVRNKETRKEIFVRIAGKLPESEGKEVLIRISKAAWEKLGGVDRFPVEIIFFE